MEIYYQIMWALVILSICEIFCVAMEERKVFIIKSKRVTKTFEIGLYISYIIGIILIVIAANRNFNVGRDLVNYIPRFQNISHVSSWHEMKTLADSYSFELGFVIVCKILSCLGNEAQVFIIASSIIVGLGFLLVSKYSKMPITMMMMFFCFGIWGSSLNVIRQFIALTLLVFSIRFIEKQEIGKFIITVLMATTIHSTSILFIVMYFFHIKPINKKFMYRFLSICLVMILIGNRLIELLVSKTSFAWYLNKNDGSGQSTLILLMTIFVGGYLIKGKIEKIDSNYNIWFGAIVLAIILNIFALRWGIFARAMKFFLPFIMILITDIMYSLRKNKILFCGISIFIIIFFVMYFKEIIMGTTAMQEGWINYYMRGRA